MIQALTCPHCNHTSGLSQNVSLQAVLKCRHCGSQFVLGEMLDPDSDAWEVVEDPHAPLPELPVLNDPADQEGLELHASEGLGTLPDWDQESSDTSDPQARNAMAETTSEVAFTTHVEESDLSSPPDNDFDEGYGAEEGFEASERYATTEDEFAEFDGSLELIDETETADEQLTQAESAMSDSAEVEVTEGADQAVAPVTAPAIPAAAPAKKKVDWSKFDNGGQEHSRTKKQTRSPIWSILSIASGGFAAVPIATLLIWHVLGKDPLEMGPAVARYVPWIVPTRFHPYQSSNEPPARFARPENRPAPTAGTSGFRKFDDVMPMPPTATDELSASDLDAASSTASMSGSEITTDTAANALTALAPVSPTLPASDANNRPTEEPASSETGAPAASDSNVFSQIKLIESDLDAWSEGKDQRETKAMVAQKLYGDLSALGLMIYEVPSGNPVHRVIADKLKKSARTIAEQSDVQAVIQAGSRFWIRENKLNASLGLALIGEVVSAEVVSGEWVLKISPEVSSRPLRIVVPGMLTPSIEVGQKLLLLGATKDTTEITSDETADNSLSQAPKEFTFVANYLYTL